MYTKVREISDAELQQYKLLLHAVQWQDYFTEDRHWSKAMVDVPLSWFPNYVNAFFVKLPAKIGHLHRHSDRDLQRPVPIESFNTVIQSNPGAVSGWYFGDGGSTLVLEEGSVYLTDRDVEHESWNYGETDRIHLLVEMPR